MRLPGIPRLPAGASLRVIPVWMESRATWFFWARAWPEERRAELYLRLYLLAPPALWAAWRFWTGLVGWWRSPLWSGLAVLAVLLLALYLSLKHESGHLCGLPDGCVARLPGCVMAEEEMVGERDGSAWGKVKLLAHQIPRGGRFCPGCKKVIGDNGGWD